MIRFDNARNLLSHPRGREQDNENPPANYTPFRNKGQITHLTLGKCLCKTVDTFFPEGMRLLGIPGFVL